MWVHICHLTLSGLTRAEAGLPFPDATSFQSAYPEIPQDLQLPALGQSGGWSRVMTWMQKTVMVVKKIIKENRT